MGEISTLGLLAVGFPTSHLAVKLATLFRGVDFVIVPDRDVAGQEGATTTAKLLSRHAASVSIAHLPGEIADSSGIGVRDVLSRENGERDAQRNRKRYVI